MLKAELLIELQRVGYDTTKKHYLLPELEDICRKMSILLTVEEPEIKPGWVNKPKGMLQILYERGYIDNNKPLSTYTKNGWKEDYDEEGNVMEDGKNILSCTLWKIAPISRKNLQICKILQRN